MTIRRSRDVSPGSSRLRLGVFKFASCDGCQLSVLNLEDDLLALGQALDIGYFPEASSDMKEGPYDIALVEGSITTAEDAVRILAVREQTTTLITIGACATTGGIQALRNWADVEAFKQAVYPSPQYIQSLSTSTPISDHVRVDFELWGCPIDKGQLLRVITDLLAGVRPRLSADSVCLECKRRGNVCVRNGRSRHSLSGTGHESRVRRDLSKHGT
jgi:sulfhydrogenase subunit delta